MEVLIFAGLALVYTFLGFVAVTKNKYRMKAVAAFIFITATLPLVNFTQHIHTMKQVSVYNFFFIGLYAVYFLKITSQFRLSKKIVGGVLLAGSFLFIYILHYVFFVYQDHSFTNILKDVKPFVTIISAYFFIDYFSKDLKAINTPRFTRNLLLVNFLISSAFYVLMVNYNISTIISTDAYYKHTELRYLSLGAYFGIFYLLSSVIKGKFPTPLNAFYAIVPLFYSGNRTLLVTLAATIGICLLLRQSAKRIFFLGISLATVFTTFVILVKNAAENSPLFRFNQLLDVKYVFYAIGNRLSPYTNELSDITWLQVVFGKGLGFAFYIPWFHYRDNVDDYNIYLDNLYLTLLAKYGIFAILCFVMIYDYIKQFNNKSQLAFYFLFFAILSLTNAVFFQYYYLWFLILLAYPFVTGESSKLRSDR